VLTKRKIMKALQHVEDPEIHQSIVDLNMVRNIKIKRKAINLEVILTIPGCPLKTKIEQDVKNVLYEIGAKEVNLQFGNMTDSERATLSKELAGHHVVSNEDPRPNLMKENSPTQFIAVTSGKGGVGKSTVTTNLAVALAKQGWRVGLIDSDIYGYSVPKMMGITQKPTMIDRLTLPVEKFGVKVMSMDFFNHGNSPIIWRGPMLGKTLRYFIEGVYWPELDYMLIDLPPGTGDIAMDVCKMFPVSKDILVTTPQHTASHVAERAGTMSVQNNRELLGIVENMAYFINCEGQKEYPFGRGGAQRLADTLQSELLIQVPIGVPEDPSFDSGEALAVYNAETEHGEIFRKLAEQVIRKIPVASSVS
jgi:ATP-binding protein involved in chromosome partitioning